MRICLSMMIKNEATLIREAIRSARPFITDWVIVDTGSTDETPLIVQEELKDLPGHVVVRPWKDYGTNRTEAIRLAKASGADFILILDADETLVIQKDLKVLELDPQKSYWMTVRFGNLSYARPNLISTKQDWKYVGVTHEYLMADPMPPSVLLPIDIVTNPSRTNKTVERCLEDVRLLEEGLKNDPNDVRYMFYLAQSYRDAEMPEKAIQVYQVRTRMGGWFEEVWYSYFQIAELKLKLNYPPAEIIHAFLEAYENNPTRGESLGVLTRYLRMAGKNHMAFIFADVARKTPRPNELLFVNESYYTWRNLDECSISAYWTGRYQESLAMCNELLKSGTLPAEESARVWKNRGFAVAKIEELKVK